MADELVNRVAASGLETFDLADYYPKQEIVDFDLRDWLFHGLILKEKDFRENIEKHDWSVYSEKIVNVYCTTDAVIPVWAYMLITVKLTGIAEWIFAGNRTEMLKAWYAKELRNLNIDDFKQKRIVVKGCGDVPVPEEAYLEITRLLLPHVKSIMYGEPCSIVPVYKQKKD
jgi:hypothetical protein